MVTHLLASIAAYKVLKLPSWLPKLHILLLVLQGLKLEINKIVRGCGLELECHSFIIDSISFGHGGFDVNVGMDWLSKLGAKIVCFEKIVQIPLSNRKILEVHGGGPEGNLKQLKTMKVNKPKLEDIPVICKFPGVFSEDLLGLPPSREVEFRIDLVPGITLSFGTYGNARTVQPT
ncbi:hypothetical protein Tco_1516141 [Tanacetum coccineum]